jgi:hypothetical protein
MADRGRSSIRVGDRASGMAVSSKVKSTKQIIAAIVVRRVLFHEVRSY